MNQKQIDNIIARTDLMLFANPLVFENSSSGTYAEGLEPKEIHKLYREATLDEITNMEPGDFFWKLQELDPSCGKVYGYVKLEVTRTEGKSENTTVHYKGRSKGSVKFGDDKIFILDKPDRLAELVEQYGTKITQENLT